jgi:hypothetical protein
VWEGSRLALSRLVDGTADRPFVYRILMPFLIRVAIQIFPMPATVYASLLIYFSLLGFVICIRSFSALYWESVMIVDAIGVVAPIMLLPLMLWNRHVYDFSTLFLFSLGLKLMAQAKWRSFFLVFILNCLNRETAALLALVFFICFWHRFRDILFWKLLLLQMVVYSGIRFAIMWKFQNNPGGIVENHFRLHLFALQMEPLLVLIHVLFGFLLLILAVWDWKKKPFFPRQAALGIVPVLSVLYLFWGIPFEIRVFYEAYPLILLLVLPTIGQFLGLQFWATQRVNVNHPLAVSLYVSDQPVNDQNKPALKTWME